MEASGSDPRDQESELLKLGQDARDAGDPNRLADVVRSSRSLVGSISKAKTAKLCRTLIDYFSAEPLASHPDARPTQIAVTRESIEWARSEKRVFLRQSLEIRLGGLLFDAHSHREALALIAGLLRELKRLDDKMVLTEVHLLESRIRHALGDGAKAKAALTSARTAANAIYCPPLLQAQLDQQSGVLHADDKDYKTAYSYFFEALEGLASQDDPGAGRPLKYMLLCKLMLNLPEDVASILNSKLAQRYEGSDTQAMQALAKAQEQRSLAAFQSILEAHKAELSDDLIVRNHLSALYDSLFEQNLLRVVEPYSRVELAFVADQIKVPLQVLEPKLGSMILDKSLVGVIDQGTGSLELFPEEADSTYAEEVDGTLQKVALVVESLYAKAIKVV